LTDQAIQSRWNPNYTHQDQWDLRPGIRAAQCVTSQRFIEEKRRHFAKEFDILHKKKLQGDKEE
jgi:hypothetical protein